MKGHNYQYSEGTAKHSVIYLMSLCKWIEERRLGDIVSGQRFLRAAKNRMLWSAIISHILKDTWHKKNDNTYFNWNKKLYLPCNKYNKPIKYLWSLVRIHLHHQTKLYFCCTFCNQHVPIKFLNCISNLKELWWTLIQFAKTLSAISPNIALKGKEYWNKII